MSHGTKNDPAWDETTYDQTPIPGTAQRDEKAQSEEYWRRSEDETEQREKRRSRYSKQDLAQLDQSLRPSQQRQYKKDMKQFGKDEVRYGKELKVYNEKKAKYDKDVLKYEKDLAKWNTDKAKYDKELADYNKLVAKHEAEVRQYDRLDARWHMDIPSFNESKAGQIYNQKVRDYINKGREWREHLSKIYRERYNSGYISYNRELYQKSYQKKWGSKIAHNTKLNELYGSRPKVSIGNIGILQRTSADILSGKSNVPLKQVSASIQRQVRLVQLQKRYNNSNMSYNDFQQAKAKIYDRVHEKASAEQARRNWSSAISARSAAVKATEKHQLMLKDMNKVNRQNQMSNQTLQNQKVKMGITKAGFETKRLQIAKGKPQQPTNVRMTKPSPVEQSSKPQPTMSIFDIPQSQFAKMQSQRGLNEKFNIGSFKSSDQGQFMKRPTLNAQLPITQNIGPQKPTSWTVTVNGKERTFKSEASANAFVQRTQPKNIGMAPSFGVMGTLSQIYAPQKIDKTNPLNNLSASQQESNKPFTSTGNKHVESAFAWMSQLGKNAEKNYEQQIKSGNEAGKFFGAVGTEFASGLLGIPTLAVMGQDLIDKHVLKKPVAEKQSIHIPNTIVGEFIGGSTKDVFKDNTLNPSAFSLDKGYSSSAKHSKQVGVSASLGEGFGLVAPFFIPGGFISKTGKASKVLSAPSKVAKTTKGKPFGGVVPVSREFSVLGKPILTKTYNQPNVVKVTPKMGVPLKTKIKEITKPTALKTKPTKLSEKVELASSKGSYSFGKTKASQVSKNIDFDPQIKTGYEPLTGTKAQTDLNLALTKQAQVSGKISASELKKLDLIAEGVDLSNKAPTEVIGGLGKKPINRLTVPQNEALFGALRNLQSPKNYLKGQRRVDQVGGSVSQNPQLKPQYRKTEIHDVDVDVRSEKVAVGRIKDIYKEVKPFETKDIKIGISEGRGTKLETTIKGEKDEFVEFLSPKDALKGNTEALTTGIRFGQKYRTDKLSRVFKKPIKDPDTGIKIRDIKDQTLAKASSVSSIQGSGSELFKGVPKPEHIAQVTKQESLIASGKLAVGPPSKRTKDIPDLYNIWKSQSEKLQSSRLPSRKKAGVRLNEVAEEFKKEFSGVDFTANTKGSVRLESTSSYTSLLSQSIKGKTPSLSNPIRPQQSESRTFESKSKPSLKQESAFSISSKSSSSPLSIPSSAFSKASPKGSLGSPKSASSPKSITSVRGSSFRSVRSSSSRSKASPRSSTASPKAPSITSVVSPRLPSITSPKVPLTPSPKSPSSPSPFSPRSPSVTSGKGLTGKPIAVPITGKATARTTRKPVVSIGARIKLKSETDKKPGKKYRTRDFLGNTRLDNIVGLFKRTERIAGDKSSARQLRADRKKFPLGSSSRTRGLETNRTKSKSKTFKLSNSKGFRL